MCLLFFEFRYDIGIRPILAPISTIVHYRGLLSGDDIRYPLATLILAQTKVYPTSRVTAVICCFRIDRGALLVGAGMALVIFPSTSAFTARSTHVAILTAGGIAAAVGVSLYYALGMRSRPGVASQYAPVFCQSQRALIRSIALAASTQSRGGCSYLCSCASKAMQLSVRQRAHLVARPPQRRQQPLLPQQRAAGCRSNAALAIGAP